MNPFCKRLLTLAVAATIALGGSAGANETTTGKSDTRMDWWRDARYGMFIHWGLYAVPAGVYNGKDIGWYGEWIMKSGNIPVAGYAKFAEQFNPVKFDAGEWVRLAKAAGMKYMIITAKHHDGFCMYKTKVDDFNIVDATPFKRDPVKELADACAKEGIKFGVYYSQAQDWHHAGGGIWGKPWDEAQKGDYDTYLQKVSIPQVRELLESIKPAVLWFDTPIDMKPERTKEFMDVLQKYPDLIYNNRLGNGVHGDTETPEQEIPANGFPGRDWETCMTMNDTWGYKTKDNNYKSTETLLRNLIDIASKGGNYLLNVGPSPEGIIPEPQVQRLKEAGQWLKVNGEAIYGTTSGPFKKSPAWGRATMRPGKLYLHVFHWPSDGKLLLPISNKVTGAGLLAKPGQKLETVAVADGLEIRLPASAPDTIASVIVLDVVGEVAPIKVPPVAQAGDGSLVLSAAQADIVGDTAKVEDGKEPNIGFWTNPKDAVAWSAKIAKPAEFDVLLTLACQPGSEGSGFTFHAGTQQLAGKTPATAGWSDYQQVSIGKIRIGQAGGISIGITPTSKPGMAVMNLRAITLKPTTGTP